MDAENICVSRGLSTEAERGASGQSLTPFLNCLPAPMRQEVKREKEEVPPSNLESNERADCTSVRPVATSDPP